MNAYLQFGQILFLWAIYVGARSLIHGGSSGIGMFAIQLANYLGARVITTVKNEKKQTSVLIWG